MRAQAEKFGAEIVEDDVAEVDLSGDIKTVIDTAGTVHRARAVIVATGSGYRKLGLPNEEELSGRGVSWCATCDGFFLRDRDIVVVGGGDTMPQAAWALGLGGAGQTLGRTLYAALARHTPPTARHHRPDRDRRCHRNGPRARHRLIRPAARTVERSRHGPRQPHCPVSTKSVVLVPLTCVGWIGRDAWIGFVDTTRQVSRLATPYPDVLMVWLIAEATSSATWVGR